MIIFCVLEYDGDASHTSDVQYQFIEKYIVLT